MPKMKTHKGAAKRIRPTSGGTKLKRACQNKNHILNKKKRERKRKLRHGEYVNAAQEKSMRTLVQAGGLKSRKPKRRPTTEGGDAK